MCDSVRMVIEPLCDGDYEVSVRQIVRQVDDDPFRMEMRVDEDGNLRIMIV